MLPHSQPLGQEYADKLGLKNEDEFPGFTEKEIKAQFIGRMFDDIPDEKRKRKISIGLRLYWLWSGIKEFFYDMKYAIRNYFKWRKTIRNLRPWEGFDGLISVVITHLKDYIETNRILCELENYHKDMQNAYKQANADSDNDFERLGQLLKENLYSWWD